jgi:hypothetical protein
MDILTMPGTPRRLLAMICIVAIAAAALAHVPLAGGGNDHLEHALPVGDPTKSWVVYDRIDTGGTAKYYRFELEEGEELRLGIFTPEESSFVPEMVVMGPGVEPSGTVPDFVEVPQDGGVVVIAGSAPESAEFEPFTPSALYPVAAYSHEVAVPGTYHVAVFEPDEAGAFGLVVGFREKFSVSEFLLVPLSVIGIHRWEGQSVFLIFAPLALTLLAGFGLLGWKIRKGGIAFSGAFGWLAVTAGLLYIGTGLMLLLQIAIALEKTGPDPAAVLTLVYVFIAVILGSIAIRTGFAHGGRGSRGGGLSMLILAFLGLFAWTGLLIGPVLALAAGVLGLLRGGDAVR